MLSKLCDHVLDQEFGSGNIIASTYEIVGIEVSFDRFRTKCHPAKLSNFMQAPGGLEGRRGNAVGDPSHAEVLERLLR